MATQALYLKYRPHTFNDIIGQEHITRTLLGAIRQDRIRHAYLFSGPRGTGKTTTARLLAKAVNCTDPEIQQRPCNECLNCLAVNAGRFLDIIEIDAASYTGVDDVRDLREKIVFAPNEGRYKIYIIDEVHRFSGNAFDALLKTLEEPPEHAIFILATTEIHKVPSTIKSRCLMFEFRRVSLREVSGRLRAIVDLEGLSVEDGALELIAKQGDGSVRDSISLLDQIVADPDEHISYELAQDVLGAVANQYVGEIVRAIIGNDTAFGLDMINEAVDTGADSRQLGRQIIEYLRQLLLIRMGNEQLVEASDEQRAILLEMAQYARYQTLVNAIRAFNAAVADMRGGWHPQLPLELALVESTHPVEMETPLPMPDAPRQQVNAAPVPTEMPVPSTSASEATPAPPEAETSIMTALTLQEAVSRWPAVIDLSKQKYRALVSLLEDYCQPSNVDGHEMLIELSTDKDWVVDKLNETERNERLLDLVQSVFGEGWGVLLKLVSGQNAQADDLTDTIATDDFLSFAQNELGAKISYPDEKLPRQDSE